MWPEGFCPTAGGNRVQSTSRPATTARSAGRSEPMDAEGKGLAIKACFEFPERATASFRKDKNRHWVSWTRGSAGFVEVARGRRGLRAGVWPSPEDPRAS